MPGAIRGTLTGPMSGSLGGPVEDVLSTIDERLVMGVPLGLTALAIIGVLLSLLVPWTWSAAMIGLVVMGVGVFAGSMVVLFQSQPKDAIALAIVGVLSGVAAIVAGRGTRADLELVCVFCIAVLFGAGWWSAKRARLDATLTWAWAGLSLACLVAGGVLVARMNGAS